MTNIPVVKSQKYLDFWGYTCNGLTIFITIYFIIQVILGFTVNGGSIEAFALGAVILPPIYGMWLYSFTQAPNCLTYRVFSWKPFQLLGN